MARSVTAIVASLLLMTPAVVALPEPAPGLISGLTDATKTLLGNLGNAPPPKLLWTPRPSPQCAAVNGGDLQCCRGALAGAQLLVVFLAQLYGYRLNPNDVNGLVCEYLSLLFMNSTSI